MLCYYIIKTLLIEYQKMIISEENNNSKCMIYGILDFRKH